MNDHETRLHRTWVQVLLEAGHRELAAAVLDADVTILVSGFNAYGLSIDLPPSAFPLVHGNPAIRDALTATLKTVAAGYVWDQNGNDVPDPEVEFRVKLLDPEAGWKAVARDLIVNYKDANQALVSEKVFKREGRTLYVYNEMKFASQSEIRIAQELENRKVLFFPLALAVRAETGNSYQDHREVDFLVCLDGTWGILEVSYHPDRFEKDAEKDSWFKKSGVLCVQHYTAERCYQRPGEVVSEFLDILAKHRR